ncbi:hypothetical protein KRX11_04515 [Pasteurellaceae bacterium TAE3-ERU1]|nr:hypothetical protein [Pasteurellaceae bacterium TAE3-ERU1]
MNIDETLKERATTHGDFYTAAPTYCALMDELRKSKSLDDAQEYAVSMIISKLVRILYGNANEADHWRDIVGYATLGGRLNQDAGNTAQPHTPYIAIKTGGTR